MLGFDLFSLAAGGIVGGYLTLALISDPEPYVDEETGEESYPLSAYIFYGATYVIKCVVKKGLELIGFSLDTKRAPVKKDNVIYFNPNPQPRPKFEEYEEDSDDELVV